MRALDDASARTGFGEAAAAFVEVVASIPADAYEQPGTEEWTVRELVGHAARAFLATESVLETPVDPSSVPLHSAAAYYRRAMDAPNVHAGISARAREAAAALGDDPAGFVRAAAARVVPLVAATPGDREVQHLAGRLRLADYLGTRVAELVLHTADLQLALGRPVTAPPVAAGVVAELMLRLADRADPLEVACALAGRAVRCNVLG